ncbi:MAG: SDR family oxidoreductase [Pseudomonadota bacterium]
MRFKGKVAIVTGGTQGIGEAVVKALYAEGAIVAVVASSSQDKADKVCRELGGDRSTTRAYVADVRSPEQVEKLAQAVIVDFGRIDLLVNCAGVFQPSPAGATPPATSDQMIDINLKGTWNMIGAVVPHMKERRAGRIVSIASVAAFMGFGNYAVYCATKAGIAMMTRALACELAPSGINVNCVAPGNTATPMNEDIRTQPEHKGLLDYMAAKTPSGRTYSAPEDIAGAVLFLLSDAGRAMHGSCMLMDEGFSAGI